MPLLPLYFSSPALRCGRLLSLNFFFFLLSSQITFSTYIILQASVNRRGTYCGRGNSGFRLITKIVLLWLTVLRPKRARIQFNRSFLISHYNLFFIGCFVFMCFCKLPNPIHGAESSAISSVGQVVSHLREPIESSPYPKPSLLKINFNIILLDKRGIVVRFSVGEIFSYLKCLNRLLGPLSAGVFSRV
jgi:hypothetical protein